MKPVYVPFAGDLYTIVLDDNGVPVKAEVARDNQSRPPEPLELVDIPGEVYERLLDKMVRKVKGTHKI